MTTYRKYFSLIQTTVTSKIKLVTHVNNYLQIRYINNKTLPITSFHTSSYLNKNVSFKLSDIGEGIREVVVKEWYVKIGDTVKQFDNICEVQSDKASVTITSRYDGVITKLYCKTEEMVAVGEPLVDIDTEDSADTEPHQKVSEATSKTLSRASEPIVKQETPTTASSKHLEGSEPIIKEYSSTIAFTKKLQVSSSNENVLCLPSVRRLAKEYQIDISKVNGTGKNNRITKEDVLNYLKTKDKFPTDGSESKSDSIVDKIVPVNTFQKAMVKSMTMSLKMPIFTYSDEISVKKLSELKNILKTIPELSNLPISYMPFFIKAMSNALVRYPILNSHYDEEREAIVYKRHHNIGVAMDTKMGLAIPVIRSVQDLSIIEIAKELQRLVKCGKEGSFSIKDTTDRSILISNIGSIGGTYVKPLPVTQTSSIIAFGSIQVLPRFDPNMAVIPDEIVALSGSADHRIIDGATMARFAKVMKEQIENPYLLLLNL